MQNLSIEVATEVGALIAELHDAGWIVSAYRYDAAIMGNWYVELDRANHRIRLVKNRSQYMIQGSQVEKMKTAGLWRAFDNLEEFRQSVRKFTTESN